MEFELNHDRESIEKRGRHPPTSLSLVMLE